MFDIILYQPEIPPNTGNIIRIAANTGCRLHLIKPLGFHLNDRTLRRAGMDYRELANVSIHERWEDLLATIPGCRAFALTTRAQTRYTEPEFRPGDAFVFGAETRGLPDELLDTFPKERRLLLPMRPASRSLNLANSVAVVVYEAWRQNGFASAERR